MSCWGPSVGPCLPAPLLLLKPSLHLLVSLSPLSLSVFLSSCLCPFLSVSVSLSAELFSLLHHPILLSLGEKSAVSSFPGPHHQHWVFCMPCFNFAMPHFLPQISQAQPPMNWQVSLPGFFLCHRGECGLDVSAELLALGLTPALPLHPR